MTQDNEHSGRPSPELHIPSYSWTALIRTQLFQSPRYFELKPISLGFALVFQSFSIGYFKLGYFKLPAISNLFLFPLA